MCKFQCLVLTDTVEGDDKVSWPLGCTTVWETYLNTTVCRNLELGDKCVCVCVSVCVYSFYASPSQHHRGSCVFHTRRPYGHEYNQWQII